MEHTQPGQWPEPSDAYLAPTEFFDHEADGVRALAEKLVGAAQTPIEKAVKLYYGVRDGWRYDPFAISLERDLYIASKVAARGAAFCIPKATLLIALARALGIPAAYGSSDVLNHLTTEKLKKRMGGKTLFIHHGYSVLYLEGKWVKAAPAFNIQLCERFGVKPTEFDGRNPAIFQEYDAFDRRHMEYVKEHGMWSDFPFEHIMGAFRDFYPANTFMPSETERFEDGVRIS